MHISILHMVAYTLHYSFFTAPFFLVLWVHISTNMHILLCISFHPFNPSPVTTRFLMHSTSHIPPAANTPAANTPAAPTPMSHDTVLNTLLSAGLVCRDTNQSAIVHWTLSGVGVVVNAINAGKKVLGCVCDMVCAGHDTSVCLPAPPPTTTINPPPPQPTTTTTHLGAHGHVAAQQNKIPTAIGIRT